MTEDPCDICDGSGKIILRVRPRKIQPADVNINNLAPDEVSSARQFSCPECGDATVKESQVAIINATLEMPERYSDDDYYLAARKNDIARAFINQLVQSGCVRFDTNHRDGFLEIHATLGVVTQDATDTIEKKAAERLVGIVNRIRAEARCNIMDWLTEHKLTVIPKRKACAYIDSAANAALQDRES